jgi:UDP-N-acetyl-2-amino-2-deoxyglucuronate dehydrogenase
MTKRFSIIGAAGFVAPRHLRAIKETGNQLVSAYDVSDALGVMDQYFPSAACFSDDHQFDLFQRRFPPDFLSVCSPNHLHFDHISMGLGWGSDVICEKPMVVDPAHLDDLREQEASSGRRVYTILQLRLLEDVQKLRDEVMASDAFSEVQVSYVSARGNWYFNSWKGREELSGGVVTNIGIHLFDLLLWVFGSCGKASLVKKDEKTVSGTLELAKARVNWKLSVDEAELPPPVATAGGRTFRQITVNGRDIRLDNGLELLHTRSYREILAGRGFGIDAAEPSIRLCELLRTL